MSSVDQLVTKFEDLSDDACSEKVTVRNKAIDQIKQIFEGSLQTIQGILSGVTKSSLTCKYVFSNIFNGLLKHATRLEQTQSQRADNKAPVFITIIQYLIDYCNQVEANRIPTSLIFDSLLKIFEDGFYARQYGLQFLNILALYLSNTNHSNFFNIDKALWKRLLDGCKQMCECSAEGSRSHAIQCIGRIVELGSSYSYLSDILVEFVPFVESLFVDAEKSGNISAVFSIGFQLTKILGVSYQFEMCLFSENVSHFVLKNYKTNMKEELKSQMFEFLHLVMVIHEPIYLTDDHQETTYTKSDWSAIKMSIERVVEMELNYLNEYKFTRDLDVLPDALLSCASYFYYLLIRSPLEENLVDLTDEIAPRNEKRMRSSSELEKILTRLRPKDKKFVWRWFVVLGAVLHKRPLLELSQSELQELIRSCSENVDFLSFDNQFKALYRICNYLVATQAINLEWESIVQGVHKATIKFQSSQAVELLQFTLENRLCSPKLILEVFKHITESPADEASIKTLALLCTTPEYKEILSDPQLEKDLVGKYLNSNGHLILARSSYENAIQLVFALLDIPVLGRDNNSRAIKCLIETRFELEVAEMMRQIEFKSNCIPKTFHKDVKIKSKGSSIGISLTPPDINKFLFRRLFKTVFIEIKDSANQQLSAAVQLMLRQLEFTARFMQRLSSVLDISKAAELLEDVFLKMEGNFKALTSAFKSEISDDEAVINKLLEYLNDFLSVDYVKDLKPVLKRSGFLLQTAIWTHHQMVIPQTTEKLDKGAVKRNAMVISNLLRLGSMEEGILKEYWFEHEINSATNVIVAFDILKDIPKIPLNPTLAKIVLEELEDIFTSHHKNEKVSRLVLEILTDLLIVFKEYPLTITEWDRFVKQYILWGCKQKYSPELTLRLLSFYERFFETFTEHRELNPELQDYIADSFSRFLLSKNSAIQMKTVQVLVRICSTNDLLCGKRMTLKIAIEYCHTIGGIAKNLQLDDLLEIENSTENVRMVSKDERQNQSAIIHSLLCGMVLGNESLERHFMRVLIKLYGRNKHLKKDAIKWPIQPIVEQHLTYLIGYWLSKDLPIVAFPYCLLNCDSTEAFLSKCQMQIAESLFKSRPWSAYVDLCEKYRIKTHSEALKRKMLVHLLLLADQQNPQLMKNLELLTGKRNLKLHELLPVELLAILRALHEFYFDEDQFSELFHCSPPMEDAVPDILVINKNCYEEAIRILNETAVTNKLPFIVTMCMKHPESILIILSNLQELMHSARFMFAKLKALQKFLKFGELLLEFVERPSDNEQINYYKEYFVKDVVLFTLHAVCTNKEIVCPMKVPILRSLLKIIKKTVTHCQEIYKDFLNRMVTQLMDLAMKNREDLILCECIADIFQHIFDCGKIHFPDALETIDILPEDHASFEMVSTMQLSFQKATIKEEIERFLALRGRGVYSFKYLRRMISENEKEFVGLFQELKEGLRIIPNTDNLAHRLVFSMLEYMKIGSEEIRVEASKILGDLGPVDMNTMVLHRNLYGSDFSLAFESQSSALCYFIPRVVESLSEMQYQYKPRLSSLIVKALIQILQQPEAETLIRARPDLVLFRQAHDTAGTLFGSSPEICNLDVFSGFSVGPFSQLNVDEWVQRNAMKMLEFLQNTTLYRVVEKELQFGRKILPLLLTVILAQKNDSMAEVVAEKFNNFFSDFENELSRRTDHPALMLPLILNESLLKLMIDLVDVIRIYNQSSAEKIALNYLPIAAAAQYCRLHGNAILYGELWAEQEKAARQCSESELPLTGLRPIMISSYEVLEVPDAVKPFLDLNQSRHKYYLLENAWEFAYLEATAGSSSTSKRHNRNESMNQSRRFSCSQFTESQVNYESIWRLGDWEQLKSISLEKLTVSNGLDDFQRRQCLALKSLNSGSEWKSKLSVHSARNCVINSIAQSSLACTKEVYDSLTALKQIRQIEDVLGETRDWKVIIAKWLRFDALQANTFEQQEQILVQRIAVLQSRNSQRTVAHTRAAVLELIRLAKEDRNYRAAITNLKSLEHMELDVETKSRMILEDGHLQFVAGHCKLANHLYLRLIHEEEFQNTFSKISALRLMAEYLTDNLTVNPSEILQTYLGPAQHLHTAYLSNSQNKAGVTKAMVEERVKINDTTAKFADTIYTQRNNYIKSSEYATKKKLHMESKEEFNQMAKTKLTKTDQQRAHNLRQTIVLEEVVLKTLAKERDKYLHLAIELYTTSCALSEGLNDLQVCRIVSLWFTNISVQSIGEYLQKNLSTVPSYKFLIILPQIAARLSHSDRVLTQIISDTLIRCCQQHPHQSIYHVLALFNAHEDNQSAEISSSMKTRIGHTKLIVNKLQADKEIGKIVKAAQGLGLALIRLANREVQNDSNTKVGQELLSLADMYRIAAPTVELPVRIDRQYSNQFAYITNWVPNFRMVGGINAPKKLMFRCSDGISRSMLVKGKDDLRQDAVMQQVFHFMNVLLKSKKSSCKRNLSIRTYKIVPLTQMSGILEFCDNTNTLGNYLVTAHERYHPEEPTVSECRKLLIDCTKKTPEEKLKQYEKICKRLSPVFQHFFTENFLNPVEWFEKRMYYINSVATTSMVGYIMGIGDRHVNNILIDKSTAEVIHIDFGIALERGKLLPTPEKVPFRLTRDLVAAMGCFGVDGLFRTSCEITMQVLRENKALINTIVEVFLYDPLYTWLSKKKEEKKKATVAEQEDDEKNALAARVLIRLNEKLNGRDENDTTTIENQVERLIRQAMSPANNAQMFYGWQPYL